MSSTLVSMMLLVLTADVLPDAATSVGRSHGLPGHGSGSTGRVLLPSLASSSQASDLEAESIRSPSQIGTRTDATPRGDRSTWFRQKDYPSEAKRNEQRGRVSITLQIDRKGVPRNCVVTGSSGWASLDQATCSLALDRARFHPARVAGKAVEGEYSLSTNWTLVQR